MEILFWEFSFEFIVIRFMVVYDFVVSVVDPCLFVCFDDFVY